MRTRLPRNLKPPPFPNFPLWPPHRSLTFPRTHTRTLSVYTIRHTSDLFPHGPLSAGPSLQRKRDGFSLFLACSPRRRLVLSLFLLRAQYNRLRRFCDPLLFRVAHCLGEMAVDAGEWRPKRIFLFFLVLSSSSRHTHTHTPSLFVPKAYAVASQAIAHVPTPSSPSSLVVFPRTGSRTHNDSRSLCWLWIGFHAPLASPALTRFTYSLLLMPMPG